MRGSEGKKAGAHEQDEHRFEASGGAAFLKFPRGAAAAWRISETIKIGATGGLLRAPKVVYTLGKGIFRINPLAPCEVGVTFEGPMYFLNYQKFAQILRDRYVLHISLRPDWRENLWPHLFSFYMRTGQWPMRVIDYYRIFYQILKDADAAALSRPDSKTRLQKIQRQISSAAILRIGRGRIARLLARENAEKIIQKLVQADFYQEMLAEMETFRSLDSQEGVLSLAGEFAHDEMRLKVPFELAPIKRFVVHGRCIVEFMWEYGDAYDGGILCKSVELVPRNTLTLPESLAIHSVKAHIPLDTGSKLAYGVVFPAPIICKGEDARIQIFPARSSRWEKLKKSVAVFLARPAPEPSNDLSIKVTASEA